MRFPRPRPVPVSRQFDNPKRIALTQNFNLRSQVDTLKHENTVLKEQIARQKQELESLKSQKLQLEKEAETRTEIIQDQKSKLSRSERLVKKQFSDNDKLKKKLEEKNAQLEEAKDNLKEAQEQNEELKEEVYNLKSSRTRDLKEMEIKLKRRKEMIEKLTSGDRECGQCRERKREVLTLQSSLVDKTCELQLAKTATTESLVSQLAIHKIQKIDEMDDRLRSVESQLLERNSQIESSARAITYQPSPTRQAKQQGKFKCQACPKKFLQFGHLKRHLRQTHEIQGALNHYVCGCSVCGDVFGTRRQYNKHYCYTRDCHPNSLEAPRSPKSNQIPSTSTAATMTSDFEEDKVVCIDLTVD